MNRRGFLASILAAPAAAAVVGDDEIKVVADPKTDPTKPVVLNVYASAFYDPNMPVHTGVDWGEDDDD